MPISSTKKESVPRNHLPIEVLENIFAHLSPRVLFRSVRPVCRRWCQVSKRFTLQNLVWSDHTYTSYYSPYIIQFIPTVDEVLSGLFNPAGRARLIWDSNDDKTTWANLVIALTRIDQQTRWQQLSSPLPEQNENVNPLDWVHPLAELVLTGDRGFHRRFNQIAPFLSSLTALDLVIQNRLPFTLDLDKILFVTCPALTRIRVEGGARPVEVNAGALLPSVDIRSSRISSPTRLRLRSLILRNVLVPQEILEHYLYMSPGLIDLQLIDLINVVHHEEIAENWRVNYRPYKRVYLIAYIQSCVFAPNLTSFHLSLKNLGGEPSESLSFEDIQQLLNFGLTSTNSSLNPFGSSQLPQRQKSRLTSVVHWGFSMGDVTPKVFEGHLFTIRNWVTSLTLTASYKETDSVKSGLHDYLCASPLLQHLRTDNMIFRVESMDPHAALHFHNIPGRLHTRDWSGAILLDDDLTSSRDIWTCRRLKTLHIRVSDKRRLERRVVHCDMSHIHTRVVFGYLAKVCPDLEELHITLAPVDLSLQSGLCLLSRLKHLERLEIAMSAPHRFWPRSVSDWDWMTRQKSYWQALLRSSQLKLWDASIREEEWMLRELSMEVEEAQSRARLESELSEARDDAVDRSEVNDSSPTSSPRSSICSFETASEDGMSSTALSWDDLSEVGMLSDVKDALQDLYADWRSPCWPKLEEIRLCGPQGRQSYVQALVDGLRR
ncbi:hypothetical protein BGZ94_000228 [Podila epigama]|nr:hypothetical protein BGZ94_000228 [Podila epigama]